ncbi:uncharacterized protein LOC133287518 [Gastrolobium bilobum]|uniref:uncharacterized protein LOC133287518 n=1 Tax=Gastrolobium bilobum TaxID=150636 RepID=UPI002AB0A63D|nr:uncharacterized protein LOC133287518 [Gastrolobium bilobum]
MASLAFSHSSTRACAKLTQGFSSTPQISSIPAVKFSPTSSTLRWKGSRKLLINQRLLTVSATNPNSRGGKSTSEGSDVNESSNAAKGPPLLTILAGFFVFFLVCWIIGSVIMWLISLIVNVPPLK